MRAGDLAPNPLNWRRHPEAQANALRGMLAEIGFAGAALAREMADGSLQLIDGHLRTETVGPDVEIPVLVLDVNAEEASKILATFDPLGAMAETDAEMLKQLLDEVEFESPDVSAMLDGVSEAAGVFGVDEVGAPNLASGDRQPFQQMSFTLSDEQAEMVKQALAAAKAEGPFVDTGNENSNGNALARIAEAYLGTR